MELIRPRVLRAFAASLVAVTLSNASFAASDEERAAARNLADKAMEAFKAARYEQAIDLFQRAETLVHSPIHLLLLGRSFAANGQLVRAQEAYLKASREELDAGAPASRVRAVDDASKELDALRPRLAELTIQVSGVEGGKVAKVTLDGADVAPVLVGVPMPVDPGAHRIEASAPGYLKAWRSITLAESQKEGVQLELVADPSGGSAEGPTAASGETTGSADAAGTQQPAAEKSPALLIGAIGGFVVAAAGGVIGTVLVAQGQAKKEKSDSSYYSCGVACRDETETYRNEANKLYASSIVPYVVGGVGLLAGATLMYFYLADDGKPTASGKPGQAHVTPWIGIASAGVRGTF